MVNVALSVSAKRLDVCIYMKLIKIEKADTFFKRLIGLIGRKKLAKGQGLWIVPCNSIHMLFMSFAIDAVFIDKNRRIKKICRNLKPWIGFAICLGAWGVLELNAGEASRLNLTVGQLVEEIF